MRVRVRERLCEDGAVRGRLRVAIEGAYDTFLNIHIWTVYHGIFFVI